MTSDLASRRDRLSPAQRALLAKRLQAASSRPDEEKLASVPRRPEAEAPRPSFAQERLWHHAREFPDRPAYNVLHSLGLSGPLLPAALAAAFGALIARHEALRTCFPAVDGVPSAMIEPEPVADPLPLVDLSALAAARFDEDRGRVSRSFGAAPFDLQRGPVARAALVHRSRFEHVLLLGAHHICLDGWSLALCARDLAALYGDLASGRAPGLAPPPRQMSDFAAWEHGRAEASGPEGYGSEISWWRRELAGLPFDGTVMPRRAGLPAGNASFTLGPMTSVEARAFVQGERATLFQLVLAALRAVMGGLGAGEVAIATPFSSRARPELAQTVGLFLNLVILRIPLDPGTTLRAAVVRARDAALAAFAHAEVPFERLGRAIEPAAEPWRTPWVRVMLNVPSGGAGHAEPTTSAGVSFLPLATTELGTDFDLTLYARDAPGGLRLDLGYGPDLLTADEGNAVIREIARVIAEGSRQPDRPLDVVDFRRNAQSGKGG